MLVLRVPSINKHSVAAYLHFTAITFDSCLIWYAARFEQSESNQGWRQGKAGGGYGPLSEHASLPS